MRLLAIGEAMAELSPAGEVNQFSLGFAGDVFNTLWYAAQMPQNISCSFFTALGTDPLSTQMRAIFKASKIDDSFLVTVPNKTIGLYMISLDKGERSFSYWRGQSAARDLANDEGALMRAVDAHDVIYLSGITLAILSSDAQERLFAILQKARAQGKKIAFDPNLRPKLWASGEVMVKVIMQGAAISDIVLPSYEDEAEWFSDSNPEATIKRYKDAGASTIIVKNGGEPIHYYHNEASGIYEVNALSHIVDSTAAGDSFNAAILANLDNLEDIERHIKSASRLAGQVVQGRGALVPVDFETVA